MVVVVVAAAVVDVETPVEDRLRALATDTAHSIVGVSEYVDILNLLEASADCEQAILAGPYVLVVAVAQKQHSGLSGERAQWVQWFRVGRLASFLMTLDLGVSTCGASRLISGVWWY